MRAFGTRGGSVEEVETWRWRLNGRVATGVWNVVMTCRGRKKKTWMSSDTGVHWTRKRSQTSLR